MLVGLLFVSSLESYLCRVLDELCVLSIHPLGTNHLKLKESLIISLLAVLV